MSSRKYIIITLTLLGLGVRGQQYIPSAKHLEFATHGIRFQLKVERYESNHTTVSYAYPALHRHVHIDSQVAKIVADTLYFASTTRDTIPGQNIRTTTKSSFVIDRTKKIFPRITLYIERYTENSPYPYYNETAFSNIILHDVTYLERNDSIVFAVDSTGLVASIAKATYDSMAQTRFSSTSTQQIPGFSILPGASFNGVITGLQSMFSNISPKQYVADFYPDTTRKLYDTTFAFTYFNNSPDTVTLKSLSYSDAYAQLMAISYTDGSPITSAKTILPYAKGFPFNVRVISKEGPHSEVRYTTFIARKEIRGKTYQDTFLLRRNINGIDYSSSIQADGYLDFHGVVGDTIQRSATIIFKDPVVFLNFDTIPTTSNYKLVSIDSSPGKAILHFRFVATLNEFWHRFTYTYSYNNFNGDIEKYPSAKWIVLEAFITEPNGAVLDEKINSDFLYDNNRRSLTLCLPEASPCIIYVLNITGMNVQTERFPSTKDHTVFLRNDLAAGIYFITARTPDRLFSYKLSVLR